MNPFIATVLNVPELLRQMLLQADYDTIMNYCRSHVQAQLICRDTMFWISKAGHDFNISPDIFRNTNLSPTQRYLQILTHMEELPAIQKISLIGMNS